MTKIPTIKLILECHVIMILVSSHTFSLENAHPNSNALPDTKYSYFNCNSMSLSSASLHAIASVTYPNTMKTEHNTNKQSLGKIENNPS